MSRRGRERESTMLAERYKKMLSQESMIRQIFMYGKKRGAEIGYENVFDYSLGNPSVPCPPAFTAAMQKLLAEKEPVALHGYCPNQGDPDFRRAVAESCARRFGLAYEAKHIFPTTGAAGALAHALRAVVTPGQKVLTFAPYFSEYGPYVAGLDAVLEIVPANTETFQPNFDKLEQMLDETVAAVLINTPNNPSGVAYSCASMQRLGNILRAKSAAFGHEIFLISDEPYREIRYAGAEHPYPAAYYDNTLTCYSFSKSMSLPGERIGYVAVNPKAEGADILVDMMAQISRGTGHNCPPSLIQQAVAQCIDCTSDLSVY